MLTLLRMPDEIYQHELDRICLPHWALSMMHTAFADPHAGFYQHTLEFLHRNYNADASQMEYAFQLLQQDLVCGRVLISRRLMDSPAFAWMPAGGDDQGRWQLSRHALPEHHAILQLTLDNAKTPLGGVRVDGAVETPSALARTFDKAKGAAKQVANDLLRRNAALNAQWQAENGLATFTDQKTGKALSPDEVKQRWESEGKDALSIAGTDQQQGAQMAKDSPAMGAAVEAAMIVGSKGRSAVRNPDDVIDGVGDWVKDKKNPKMPIKPIRMNQYEPPCFQPGPDSRKNYKGSDKDFEKEYHKQLKMQENGINSMSVGEYLDNRRILQELTDQHGSEKARKILTQGGRAQAKQRDALRAKIKASVQKNLENSGVAEEQADKLAREHADKQMEQLAALHNPDLIAGGKDEIGRIGNKGVNSSIGSQWPKQGRVTGMDDAAKSALEQFGPDAKMNVKLERCR